MEEITSDTQEPKRKNPKLVEELIAFMQNIPHLLILSPGHEICRISGMLLRLLQEQTNTYTSAPQELATMHTPCFAETAQWT
jgi:hypothetical protein